MRLLVLLVIVVCPAAFAAADTVIATDNRDLFMTPASAALAGSDEAFARDGTPHCSPDALAEVNGAELTLSYAGFYGNTFSTSILSYARSIDAHSGLGVSLSYLYVPGIQETDRLEADPNGGITWDPTRVTYSFASDVMARFGYARGFDLSPIVKVGAGVAVDCRRVNLLGWTGYGMGIDAGARIEVVPVGISTGFDCVNISTSRVYWNSHYRIVDYPHVKYVLGWEKEIPYLYGRTRIGYTSLDLLCNDGANAYDANDASASVLELHPTADPLKFLLEGSFGLEHLINERVALRVGRSATHPLTFGGSVHLLKRLLILDFAYLTHDLSSTYQLGLACHW